MSDQIPDVAEVVRQIEQFLALTTRSSIYSRSETRTADDLLRSCLAVLKRLEQERATLDALLAGERYAAALRLEQYWEAIGQPRPGRDDAQDWEDLVDCLAVLRGQMELRERLETALRRARVYVEGARSYGAADLAMIDAALGLSRECNQCGWKPSPDWMSERCGSLPFGSCDGTVAPPASTPEER